MLSQLNARFAEGTCLLLCLAWASVDHQERLKPLKEARPRREMGDGFIGKRTSLNHLGWEGPLRSLSPSVNLTLPSPPLNHAPKCHIYTSYRYLQGW